MCCVSFVCAERAILLTKCQCLELRHRKHFILTHGFHLDAWPMPHPHFAYAPATLSAATSRACHAHDSALSVACLAYHAWTHIVGARTRALGYATCIAFQPFTRASHSRTRALPLQVKVPSGAAMVIRDPSKGGNTTAAWNEVKSSCSDGYISPPS